MNKVYLLTYFVLGTTESNTLHFDHLFELTAHLQENTHAFHDVVITTIVKPYR